MASVTTTALPDSIGEPVLMDAVQSAVHDCLAMADVTVRCVSVSSIPTREPGSITGLIGVHGDATGFITVNVAEAMAIEIVGALLIEKFDSLNHQVIDGIGELTNMISGGVKKGLGGTPWAFSNVTVPSVIVGQNYNIAYAQGFQYLSMTFEHLNCQSIMVHDRLICVAVSLICV